VDAGLRTSGGTADAVTGLRRIQFGKHSVEIALYRLHLPTGNRRGHEPLRCNKHGQACAAPHAPTCLGKLDVVHPKSGVTVRTLCNERFER
jgi:hypothetical protein